MWSHLFVCDGVCKVLLLQTQEPRSIAERCIALDPAAVVCMHGLNLQVAQPQDPAECPEQGVQVLLLHANVCQCCQHLLEVSCIIHTINVLHASQAAGP